MSNPVRDLLDAALACPECEAPIQRTEIQHQRTPDGWRASGAVLVCRTGCRVPVEPYPLADPDPET